MRRRSPRSWRRTPTTLGFGARRPTPADAEPEPDHERARVAGANPTPREPIAADAMGSCGVVSYVGPQTELRDHVFDDVLYAARAGAEWAWVRIYEQLAPKVVGYLRAHGASDPEDLAGEVFLHVVRGLPEFSGGERDFNAWTFTIAHRRLIDDVRRRGRRPLELLSADTIAG